MAISLHLSQRTIQTIFSKSSGSKRAGCKVIDKFYTIMMQYEFSLVLTQQRNERRASQLFLCKDRLYIIEESTPLSKSIKE